MKIMHDRDWQWVHGKVVVGFGVASGRAKDSPYEDGSVILQKPHFKSLGVDISDYYPGTINVSVSPYSAKLSQPDTTLRQVDWHDSIQPEDFSFLALKLKYADHAYDALLYYPHPDTKLAHHQSADVIEVLAPEVTGLKYGDELELGYPDGSLFIK